MVLRRRSSALRERRPSERRRAVASIRGHGSPQPTPHRLGADAVGDRAPAVPGGPRAHGGLVPRAGAAPDTLLPDLLLLAPDLFRQKPIGRIPERLMERIEASPAPGESVRMPSFDLAPPALALVEPPPPDDILRVQGERPPVFLSKPDMADFSLNDRDIEAVTPEL